jgi:hypothetical protein
MVDEDKLKKLLDEIVTSLGHLIPDSYYKQGIMEHLKDKIESANLTKGTK